MFNADKYRSVTWLKGGRVYPQLDCFGIVNEIRRDLKLPLWPDFAGVSPAKGLASPAIPAQRLPMSGSLSCSITSCRSRNVIQARGLRFCHWRDSYDGLTAWSSGNDDKVLSVPAAG